MKFDIHDKIESEEKRFILGTSGQPKLFALGVNPSTANKERSDTTITKVGAFSKNNGFFGFVMLNLCPLRSTNPDELPESINKEMTNLAECNRRVIREILEPEDAPVIWAAWGDNIGKRPYLFGYLLTITEITANRNAKWQKCGEFTKRGHPRHPSRLGYKNRFTPFNIEKYLCAFAPLR